MFFDPNNSQQDALYHHAIQSLNKANKVAEHHKPAKDPKEVAFMKEVNQSVTRSVHMTPYQDGQYEAIFYR